MIPRPAGAGGPRTQAPRLKGLMQNRPFPAGMDESAGKPAVSVFSASVASCVDILVNAACSAAKTAVNESPLLKNRRAPEDPGALRFLPQKPPPAFVIRGGPVSESQGRGAG